MTEVNNTEVMLKQLMDMVTKQNEEISKLKEINGGERFQPQNHITPLFGFNNNTPNNNSDIVKDELERIKKEESNKEELLNQARLQIQLENEAKTFNNKYGSLINNNDTLSAIDKANYDDDHKLKLKFKTLFNDKNNKELLSGNTQKLVDNILAINDTEIAKKDITQDYFNVMQEFNHSQDLQAKATAKYGSVGITNTQAPLLKTQEWAKNIRIINR